MTSRLVDATRSRTRRSLMFAGRFRVVLNLRVGIFAENRARGKSIAEGPNIARSELVSSTRLIGSRAFSPILELRRHIESARDIFSCHPKQTPRNLNQLPFQMSLAQVRAESNAERRVPNS
jgi:hypothetical protein